MAVLFDMPCCAAGEAAFDAATKVVGSGQAVEYTYASSLAGEAGDVLYTIANTNAVYLDIPLTSQLVRFRSRMYLDFSDMTFGANDQFSLTRLRGTVSSDTISRLYIGNVTSTFGILPTSYAESATSLGSAFTILNNEPMWVEEEFVRSSGVGVNDAVYTVWVNDVQIHQRTGFINYTSFGKVNKVWVGGVQELDAGTSGVLKMGKIKITNTSTPIGPYVAGSSVFHGGGGGSIDSLSSYAHIG